MYPAVVQNVGQEILVHLLPPGPVVVHVETPEIVHVETPEITPGGDAFGPEGFVQDTLRADAFVFPGSLAYAENDAPLVEQPDVGVVRSQVRHKGGGGVVVEGVVHPGPEEIVGVVAAGETDDTFEQVGTAQEHDGCVGGAHAAARGSGGPLLQ